MLYFDFNSFSGNFVFSTFPKVLLSTMAQSSPQQSQQQQQNEEGFSRELRFLESESIDSLAVPGLGEEYLILSFPGSVKCGKLFNKGGQIGLLANSLQFNLITFTDVLGACEAMIASMPSKMKSPIPLHHALPRKKVTKAKFGQRLDTAEFRQEAACFYIEETARYRLCCLYFLDGTVGLGRAFCKFDITHGSQGEEGMFEIAKGSLLKFESIGHYVRFLKSIFDQCMAAYAKRSQFIPIVTYLFNKIDSMTKAEKEELNSNKQAVIESLLPLACEFAGEEVAYVAKEPKKFISLVPMTFYILEEINVISSFFKNTFKYLDLGEFYIGDSFDGSRLLAPKKAANKTKKRPALALINLDGARTSAAPAAQEQRNNDDDEEDTDDDDNGENNLQKPQKFFGKKN